MVKTIPKVKANVGYSTRLNCPAKTYAGIILASLGFK
uniref:Uncharacterized protein n=1 Tax=Medicago truncatula TaxID=3880 RepID=I3T6H2_MEDTR|nr:unknown [Medicago truncatula]